MASWYPKKSLHDTVDGSEIPFPTTWDGATFTQFILSMKTVNMYTFELLICYPANLYHRRGFCMYIAWQTRSMFDGL